MARCAHPLNVVLNISQLIFHFFLALSKIVLLSGQGLYPFIYKVFYLLNLSAQTIHTYTSDYKLNILCGCYSVCAVSIS